MRILLVEPSCPAAEAEISRILEGMQKVVGGAILAVYPFEEPVALICNDEGKLLGLPLNRDLWDGSRVVYNIIAGTFFLCNAPVDAETFTYLTDEQMGKYRELFARLELFLNLYQ